MLGLVGLPPPSVTLGGPHATTHALAVANARGCCHGVRRSTHLSVHLRPLSGLRGSSIRPRRLTFDHLRRTFLTFCAVFPDAFQSARSGTDRSRGRSRTSSLGISKDCPSIVLGRGVHSEGPNGYPPGPGRNGATRSSCSDFAVPHRRAGFLLPCRAGVLQRAADPGVRRVSTGVATRFPAPRPRPSEAFPPPAARSRSALAVRSLADRVSASSPPSAFLRPVALSHSPLSLPRRRLPRFPGFSASKLCSTVRAVARSAVSGSPRSMLPWVGPSSVAGPRCLHPPAPCGAWLPSRGTRVQALRARVERWKYVKDRFPPPSNPLRGPLANRGAVLLGR
jgi:hypothetical protein